ncbi:glycerophosphodiester phosphodiesterase [Cellulophaga sp. F20128]|uniref:glycerophosphodiester phosphodiesterase n=1 Tax=Cellulophaga sp. F20128 TaxID=2926413 RepID=UPI001FF1A600|nr:glycerophosphodiester phosphodiesterase family protein [Cellulophaga sp. F20128]MCK0158072.1 glycerophosphodiester phosphodiesterase [Cellulophaga sp. F20128]
MNTKYTYIAIILSLFLLQSCSQMNEKVLVIGHRGAMGHETENTLASIQKALDLGVDMIEIDVFKVKSGELVVFHDSNVERLTDGVGSIEEYTWQELQKLNLVGNHKIPLLTDVLQTIDAKVGLNIELKGAHTARGVNAIIKEVIDNKSWTLDNFLISSFNWNELAIMRQINNDIAIALLTGKDPQLAIPIALELNAVAINPDAGSLTAEDVKAIKAKDLKIYTYTVNELQEIQKMKDLGVDGIFTNYPERVY